MPLLCRKLLWLLVLIVMAPQLAWQKAQLSAAAEHRQRRDGLSAAPGVFAALAGPIPDSEHRFRQRGVAALPVAVAVPALATIVAACGDEAVDALEHRRDPAGGAGQVDAPQLRAVGDLLLKEEFGLRPGGPNDQLSVARTGGQQI